MAWKFLWCILGEGLDHDNSRRGSWTLTAEYTWPSPVFTIASGADSGRGLNFQKLGEGILLLMCKNDRHLLNSPQPARDLPWVKTHHEQSCHRPQKEIYAAENKRSPSPGANLPCVKDRPGGGRLIRNDAHCTLWLKCLKLDHPDQINQRQVEFGLTGSLWGSDYSDLWVFRSMRIGGQLWAIDVRHVRNRWEWRTSINQHRLISSSTVSAYGGDWTSFPSSQCEDKNVCDLSNSTIPCFNSQFFSRTKFFSCCELAWFWKHWSHE